MGLPTETDFVVVGAGIAGLRAAISLAESGRVLVLTKESPGESNTSYAQGGIAVAMGGEEDVALHLEDTVRGLKPNLALLARFPVRGVIVTSRGTDYDFVSRFFAPAAGINEDPVTGSAHVCLGPFWASRLNKTEFVAYQVGHPIDPATEGAERTHIGRAALSGEVVEIADVLEAPDHFRLGRAP